MAREEILSYKSILEERQTRIAFDLNVNVLSASAWPSYPNITVNVPENILKATGSFEQHYKVKHSGRKLEWKHALAHCQLKAIFPKGLKEIVVSCFQAVILTAFNKNESMTYRDLQAFSGLGKWGNSIPPIPLLKDLRRHRTQADTPVACVREVPRPQQRAKKQRCQRHRYLHCKSRLHPSKVPHKDQSNPSQRDQARESADP